MENELAHYGVLGMRWGVRKARKTGRQLTKAEKKWVMKTPNRVRKNKKKLTAEEIKKALADFEQDKKLRDLDNSILNSGKKKVLGVMALATGGLTIATLASQLTGGPVDEVSKPVKTALADIIKSVNMI